MAAYLHQDIWGKCASEDDGNTAVKVLCSDDNLGLDAELSFLQYRSYTLERINILLNSIYSHPIIVKSVEKELFTLVVTLTVTNTIMLDLDEALVLRNVSELTINDCSLVKIKFDDIVILQHISKLNASQNSISLLKSAKLGKEQRLMQTIDLSYNLLSGIPDYCFASFSQLKHLNLSHNSISYISVTAFEGISELKSLSLSYNKLSSITNIATKLINLKFLYISYNYISKIDDLNSMIGLEEVKLDHNEIKLIDENAFQTLSNLETLDLSGNQIRWVHSHFQNNNNLRELRLTDNNIIGIGRAAVDGKRLKKISINGNKNILLMVLMLDGVNCDYLDLSDCDLQYIRNDTFIGATLRSINVSTNALSQIGLSTFSIVKDLQELDLSNNVLISLAFLKPGVYKLMKLILKKNMINVILNNTFGNFSSLELLDLSYNVIHSIECDAFVHLTKLEILLLHNNRLFSIQVINIHGLSALVNFDLSYTDIGNLTQAAVPGLQVTTFNCSHSELSRVHFDAFAEVGHIVILDLSHNSLIAFEVNPKDMSTVNSLYLNNNKITSITNASFAGFIELRVLHLQFNNIVNIHPKAFSSLISLRILNLSDNRDLEITGDIISNLRVLVLLTISNNKKSFNFQHTENTTIEQVDLSLSDIGDLASLYVFNIKGVVSLNLSKNMITYIDRKSFKAMPQLRQLDISFNLIKSIEPGSFINTENVAILNLHGNQLTEFQHGVFQGLTGLQKLNLSNNLIHDFNVNLLHGCIMLQEISFENNLLNNLELRKFLSISVMRKLYLGGNNISCQDIASYKKYFHDVFYNLNILTSETPIYHTSNVDGVTCRAGTNTGNNDANCTMDTAFMSKFADSLENILKSIDNFNKDYYVKGIFYILIVILVASIILVVVKHVPLRRYFLIVGKPLNGNLRHNFSYNNITQRISNNDE